jgi:adenosylhomocysteine nucleosidase
MGGVRVLLAVNALLAADAVESLVSTGLAGGCDPALPVGSLVHAATVVDAQSGARFSGLGGAATVVTTHSIASVQEKQRLFASYGAAAVDMEAATVARLAQMHGLNFRAIKAVSDAHDFELSALSRFASPHGHFRTGAFALHTALRPRSWRHAMKLGAGSQRALRSLTETLKEIAL